ncbi:autotransporter assembly complex protein TamA [Rheinheimera sp. WS51]|uniref:autotransporter assembly complex protein TamA n=1 Tax=Rheinheimera sp. WS51 TaxID=3425886 RepID=UPI003D8C3AC5
MLKPLITYTIYGFLLFSSSLVLAQETSIKLLGVKGAVKENIELYIASVSLAQNPSSIRFRSQLEQEISTALQALGYYQSKISFSVEGEKKQKLLIAIEPGEQVTIAVADIQITGDGQNDPDFITIINQQAPKVGESLHHGRYDGLKSAFNSLALRKGYFDASFSLNKLEVSPSLNEAYIRLHYNSGPRYLFGEVKFDDIKIDLKRLQSLVPFTPNTPYQASLLGKFNQDLSATGWFSTILVEADADAEDIKDHIVPLHVNLDLQKRNIVETGIGYSDDIGPRFQLNWHKPWLNSAGHSLTSKLQLSKVEQTIEAGYKIPLESVSTDFYQIQFGLKNKDNKDTQSRESNLVFERHWLLKSDWYRTASLRWLTEDYVQADDSGNSNLIMPGLSYSRSRSNQGKSRMPTSADRFLISMEFSDPIWLSDLRFIRLRSRIGWIKTLSSKHRVVARADAGAVLFEQVENLSPSLRFFAGGVDNLRGYSYESVSPYDEDGKLIGGRYMATASAEYQYNVKQNWWLATFFDYGSAWNSSPDWKKGVGLGLRWASPVGPVRIDFAFGLDKLQGNGFQLHLSLGPEI